MQFLKRKEQDIYKEIMYVDNVALLREFEK